MQRNSKNIAKPTPHQSMSDIIPLLEFEYKDTISFYMALRGLLQGWDNHIRLMAELRDRKPPNEGRSKTFNQLINNINPGKWGDRKPKWKTAKKQLHKGVALLNDEIKELRLENHDKVGTLTIEKFLRGPHSEWTNGPKNPLADIVQSSPKTRMGPMSTLNTRPAPISEPDDADTFLDNLLDQIKRIEPGSKKRALDLRELCARYLKAKNRLSEAANYFCEAADDRETIEDFTAAARLRLHQANALYRCQHYDRAVDVLIKAVTMCEDRKLNKFALRTYLRLLELLGLSLAKVGRNNEGLKILLKAEEICNKEEFFVPWFDATRQSKIGIVCWELKDKKTALRHMRKASKIRRERGFITELARGLKFIVFDYLDQKTEPTKILQAFALLSTCLAATDDSDLVESANVRFRRLEALKALREIASRGIKLLESYKMESVIEGIEDSEDKASAKKLMDFHKPEPRNLVMSEAARHAGEDYRQILDREEKLTKLGYKTKLTQAAQDLLSDWPDALIHAGC
jgi:tetratricopeptide (TPR) repeat protein